MKSLVSNNTRMFLAERQAAGRGLRVPVPPVVHEVTALSLLPKEKHMAMHRPVTAFNMRHLKALHIAMGQNDLRKRLIERLTESISSVSLAEVEKPLGLDILPVKVTSLIDISEGDLMPLSYGCSFAEADGFIVRVKYANHYQAIYSTLRYETSYAAAIHLSIETGLIYEGHFNV